MILLTGGTGFVGRNLARELRKGSFEVRCLVRDPQRAAFLRELGCELARGDIWERSSVIKALGGVDSVIHLVGVLVESKGASFRRVHIEGTRNVVEACMERGVGRYLHISALGTRKGARSEYHRTKWEAEEIIRASGLIHTIFRPSVIFGKEDRFTNLFARLMRLSPFIIVPGGGRNRMQPVFVYDLVRAMKACLSMPETANKAYEVAGPQDYTFNEILDMIAGVIGKRVLKVHAPMAVMRTGASIAEAVLPKPPITRDNLLLLSEDNVTKDNALPKVFGIEPTGFTEGMRTYLH